MQISGFFLIGVLLGTVAAVFIDFKDWTKPGEPLDWGYVGESVKGAFLMLVGGESYLNLFDLTGANGAGLLAAGLLAGAVAHWRASGLERKHRVAQRRRRSYGAQ